MEREKSEKIHMNRTMSLVAKAVWMAADPVFGSAATWSARTLESLDQALSGILDESGVDSFPVEICEKVIDVRSATRAILVIVGVLENIARNQWDSTPHRTVVVFVNELVEK